MTCSSMDKYGGRALQYIADHKEVEAEDVETILGGILAWAESRRIGPTPFIINYKSEFSQVGPMLAT